MKAVVWVYDDCLSPRGPALLAHPGAPALFVFDDEALRRDGTSLKRIAFVYECLAGLPVVIRRGDVAEEVVRFAAEHEADTVAVAASIEPRFHRHAAHIGERLAVE